MKKVLSLVLALAMVLGMSTMAFATDYAYTSVVNVGTFVQDDSKTQSLSLPLTADQATAVLSAGSTLTATITSNTSRADSELEDFFLTNNLTVTPNSTTNPTKLNITFTAAKDSNTNKWLPVGNYNLRLVINDGSADNLVYSNIKFDVVAKAGTKQDTVPSTYKITGIADNWTDFVQWDDIDASAYPSVTQDTTMSFQLVAGMFYWEDQYGDIVYATNITGDPYTPVRSSHLNNVKTRKTEPVNNSGTVKAVGISGSKMEIETVANFLKCGDTDVAFDLDMTYKSSASGDKLYINFNIFNEEEEVEDGVEYVYTEGAVYIKATNSVRNLEMRVGEGLSLFKGMGTGQKAYANVSLELSAGDEKLYHQFPELSDVYTLYTVGVSSANVYAQFTDLDDTYFVYDENYKLIGTTADTKIPFSNKYYLTTAKVDLAGTDVENEDPSDEPVPGDDTENVDGGAGTAPVNNYNPNTGA